MLTHRSVSVDDMQNSLRIDVADEDGCHLVEVEGGGKVYIYNSEIDLVIDALQKYKSIIINNK